MRSLRDIFRRHADEDVRMTEVGYRRLLAMSSPEPLAAPEALASPEPIRRPKVCAVGGGKGGVGKSFISANLALATSKYGKKVLVIDADLGAANLHTFFNVEAKGLSFSNFLKSEVVELNLLLNSTDYQGLDFISGQRDSLDAANLNGVNISRLDEALQWVDHEYVFLDIGPGTSSSTLDIFLLANRGVLVTTPEPTSIENTYRFIKCLFWQRIKKIFNSEEDPQLKKLLQKVYNLDWSRKNKVRTIEGVLSMMRLLDPERGEALKRLLGKTKVFLLVNMARDEEDEKIGPTMERACRDFFGIDIEYLGCIRYEDSVSDSIRRRRPLTVHYGQSDAARGIDNCLQRLMRG